MPNAKLKVKPIRSSCIRIRTTNTFQRLSSHLCGLKGAFAFHCVNICFGNVEAVLAKVQTTTNEPQQQRLEKTRSNHILSLALQWWLNRAHQMHHQIGPLPCDEKNMKLIVQTPEIFTSDLPSFAIIALKPSAFSLTRDVLRPCTWRPIVTCVACNDCSMLGSKSGKKN